MLKGCLLYTLGLKVDTMSRNSMNVICPESVAINISNIRLANGFSCIITYTVVSYTE